MRVTEPFAFSVSHQGRGGHLTCTCEAGMISLGIEMEPTGDFSVSLRGAQVRSPSGKSRRLRKDERPILFDRLRAWLDETERMEWVIEPVRPGDFLSAEILRAVRVAFPRADQSAVIAHLSQYRGPEPERVWWGILILADGDRDAALKLVKNARTDYRDILYWAEYPEEAGSRATRAEHVARYERLRATMDEGDGE